MATTDAKKKEKKAEKAKEREKAPLKMPKKQKDAPPTRAERIALLKSRVNDAFEGKGAILSGDDFSNIFMLRRPTGITNLDVALGGGWPAGGLSQVIGEDNAGKTYLVDRTMVEVQKTYKEESALAACMTESKFDKGFAKGRVGLQISYSALEIQMLEESRAKHGLPRLTDQEKDWLRHQVGEFQEAVFQTGEQLLEAAVQMVEENVFQIVLIDSFGAILTAAEAESDEGLEGRHYGGASGVITQFMHRLHAALNLPDRFGRPNTTTVLGINQYRENLKATGKYDDPLQIAGGRALKHGKLVDVLLRKGAKIRVGEKGKEIIVGKEINWKIIKGKAGCHDGPHGDFKFYYGEHGWGFGADVYQNLVLAGLEAGVVEKSGNWYGFKGEAICNGQDNAAAALMARPEWFEEIRQAIFSAKKLDFITKETF